MTLAHHRIAASAILFCASLSLIAVGRTLIQDTAEVAALRQRLDGKWIAKRVVISPQVTATRSAIAATTVEFAGRQVHFSGLIDASEARGTYQILPATPLGKVDFKLDAGWMMGAYILKEDQLTIIVNALKLPEQLGVPARGRPEIMEPSQGRFVYEFRKVR